MRFLLVISLCVVLTLGSAYTPLLETLLNGVPESKVPDEVVACLSSNQKVIEKCTEEIAKIIEKHEGELKKHKSDPINLPDNVKKDVCCGEFQAVDCIVEGVRGTPGCPEKLKKFYHDTVETDPDFKKVCTGKFSREGCKK